MAEKIKPGLPGQFVIGTKENPYTLVIPAWAEKLIQDQEGMSAQDFYNAHFSTPANVVVV